MPGLHTNDSSQSLVGSETSELDVLSPLNHDNTIDGPDVSRMTRLVGTKHVKGPKWARSLILSASFFANQSIWSTEMAYGTLHPVEYFWDLLTLASVAFHAVARSLEVPNSTCVSCGTTLWTHCSTSHRSLGRSLYIPLWTAQTVHVRWFSSMRAFHASSWMVARNW